MPNTGSPPSGALGRRISIFTGPLHPNLVRDLHRTLYSAHLLKISGADRKSQTTRNNNPRKNETHGREANAKNGLDR